MRSQTLLKNLALSASLVLLTFAQGCPGGDGVDWYDCIKQQPSSSPSSTAGKAQAKAVKDGFGQVSQPLYIYPEILWGQTLLGYGTVPDLPTPKKIPVCWEASAYAKPEYEKYRNISREAVEETWERALDIPGIKDDERIRFVGWEKCKIGEPGVKIAVPNTRPNSHLGNYAYLITSKRVANPAEETAHFDFEFTSFSPNCGKTELGKRYCIQAIAVHEFGHVLGIEHEQDRPDAVKQDDCDDVTGDGHGGITIGPYDIHSTMNYCNPRWNNRGELSRYDILGIQKAYYPDHMDETCDLPVVKVAQKARPAAMRKVAGQPKPAGRKR